MKVPLRSPEEIDVMRSAGAMVRHALDRVAAAVRPGITTAELDAIAEAWIVAEGGRPAFKGYQGYPATLCCSINEEVVHGIPSKRRLQVGEIISGDVGVEYKGFFADGAATWPVGSISAEAARLIAITDEALQKGIEQAVVGNRLFDISSAIQKHVEAHGFSVVRSFVGHGIGTRLHQEPEIPNYGMAGRGLRLEAGMVLAIEPMVNAGSFEVEVLEDGWTAVTRDRSLSAHFEETVAVTREGPKILTRG